MTVVTEITADGESTTETHTLYFAYDTSGTPMFVTYDGTNYYYATNLQGDVTAILNTSGTAVVEYTYDAWGNILTTTGSMASTLGSHNPLLYRGYVYDHEVGLYYLQSRYYNAGLGRFNAPDAFTSTGQGLLGNNMFAYCRNNPVSRRDVTGTFDKEAYETDGDPTSDEGDHRGMRASTGAGLSTFKTSLKDAAAGLRMAGGQRNGLHFENHHIASNKNKTYTPYYEEIMDRYDMSLNNEENIVRLPEHRGRHTNEYHDFIRFCLEELDAIADGAQDTFREGWEIVSEFIADNPWLPYAKSKR